MSNALIQVRCCAHHGEGVPADLDQVAQKIVQQALSGIDIYKHPPRLLLLLATPDWCDPSRPISKAIRDQFEISIGNRPAVVGASAPTIFCSEVTPQVIDKGLLLVAVFTPEMKLSVRHMEKPFSSSGKPRAAKIKEMLKGLQLDRNIDIAIGTSAQWALLAFFPGAILVGEDDWSYRDGDLCTQIAEDFGYSVYGVSPGSALGPSHGFQFANDVCLKSGLVLALMEHDLRIGSCLEHGFRPVPGALGARVDSLADGETSPDGDISGYVVTQFDGRPATEILLQIKEIHDTGPAPPIGIRRGNQYEVNAPFSYPSSPKGSVRLKNRVYVGDWYVPMTGDQATMAKACIKGMIQAQSRIGVTNRETALLMEFAGAGREKYYVKQGTSWGAVAAKVASHFPGIPVVGTLCAGEFAELRSKSYPANAHSAWFTCISTERTYRGKNRSELQRIQEAAKNLLTCNTPDEVMQMALAGTIAAGAEGGCISRLNAGIGRILGSEGQARTRPESRQRWTAALADIDYLAPGANADASLPNYMAQWAKPALAGISETSLTSDSTKENILEIVARTKHALFLPSPEIFAQNRRRESVERVGIEAQLFSNAQRNRLKLLFWDGSGLWVCAKRLEKGRFRWLEADGEESKITLGHEEVMLLIGGIDLAQTSRRAWHRVKRAA